jgi:glycerophosphoryl diester phosphodiesterase
VIISSFCWQPLVWCRDHIPDVKRACLWSTDTWSWPFFASLAPPIFLDRCATRIFHPHFRLVDANLMDQARARGWIVYPWVGMKEEEGDREGLWSAMKTFGVAGLCTNYPRQLRAWLADARLDEQFYQEPTAR